MSIIDRSMILAIIVWLLVAHSAAAGSGVIRDGASSANLVASAQQHIVEREYWASRNDQGLQAPNRRQGLRTYFEPQGIKVVDRTAAGAPKLLTLRLEGLGRGVELVPMAPAEVHHENARVELRRPGLVEWYENRPEGLEQGFTLAKRPAGEGPLVLALRVAGARALQRGETVALRTNHGRRLAYGKL